LTHTELFEEVFPYLRDNMSVDVYPEWNPDRDVHNSVVIELSTSNSEQVMFSNSFDAATTYTMVLMCVGSDVEQANSIYDELYGLLETNPFNTFGVTNISDVIESTQYNQTSYHIRSMSVQFR